MPKFSKPSNSPTTPGVVPGPKAPPDPPQKSTSVGGVLLTPDTTQNQGDVSKLMKRGAR